MRLAVLRKKANRTVLFVRCSSIAELFVLISLNELRRRFRVFLQFLHGIDLCSVSCHSQEPPTQSPHLVNKIKQLANIVGDGGRVRVAPLQVLLVDLAHALHALVYALVVAVRPCLRIPGRLDEENRVRHLVFFPFLLIKTWR